MLSFTVKPQGLFVKQLNSRIAKLGNVSGFGILLNVPYEHRWWYWQEFGTAGGTEPPNGGELPPEIGVSNDIQTGVDFWYEIEAKKESKFLVYEKGGQLHFAKKVYHPGIKARKPIRAVLDSIVASTQSKIQNAITQGAAADPQKFRDAVREAGISAKDIIVKSFGQRVPGKRAFNSEYPKQSGRLEGKTAAEVLKQVISLLETQ